MILLHPNLQSPVPSLEHVSPGYRRAPSTTPRTGAPCVPNQVRSLNRTMTDERFSYRVAPKGLVSKMGQVFLSPNGHPIECRVVDLSAGGACLEFSTKINFPQRFEFRHGGLRKFCLLAWQRQFRLGIRFEASRHRTTGNLSRPSSFRRPFR